MNFSNLWNITYPHILDRGPTIAVVIIAVLLLLRFGNIFIEKAIRKSITSGGLSKTDEEKRENTLIRVFGTAFNIFVLIVGAMIFLSEIGIDTAPLLASAGIAGIAIGFGGQYLIKDLINGFFIIFENQYRVGDVVRINGQGGVVEDINLRITTIRDLDGIVHTIPNGEVISSSNMTKVYSNVNLDLGVAYDTNLDRAIKVINKVGDELAKDKDWKDQIIEAPHFLRVNDFADSAIMLKILGKTEPIKQWAVAGEFRKRIKAAFDKESIEIPFPQRDVHMKKS